MIAGLRSLLIPRTLPTPEAARADHAWRVVVIGWAVLSLLLLVYVARYGSNAPLADEWGFIRPLVGEAALGPWLWEAHGDHRFPLPRLLWVAAFRLSGSDFRAAMFLSATLASAVAFGLIALACRLRGRSHLADLLIPVLTLHVGHWENWLIGYQLAYILVMALTGAVLMPLLGRPGVPSAGVVLRAGAAVALLPLCCGAGVLFAAPLALWVGFAAVQRLRAGDRIAGVGLLVLPAVTLVMIAAAIATRPAVSMPPTHDRSEQVRAAVELLAAALRPAAVAAWPVSGGAIVVVYLVAAAGLSLIAIRRRGPDRLAALGLLAVLAGAVAVAGAVGVSRGGMFAGVGFSPRYAAFSAAGLIAVYLAAARFVPLRAHRAGATVAVVASIVVVAFAVREARTAGTVYELAESNLRKDATGGMTDEELAARYGAVVFHGDPRLRPMMVEGLEVCRRHRIGPFRP
jgi:hypothetical protein